MIPGQTPGWQRGSLRVGCVHRQPTGPRVGLRGLGRCCCRGLRRRDLRLPDVRRRPRLPEWLHRPAGRPRRHRSMLAFLMQDLFARVSTRTELIGYFNRRRRQAKRSWWQSTRCEWSCPYPVQSPWHPTIGKRRAGREVGNVRPFKGRPHSVRPLTLTSYRSSAPVGK